MAATYLDLVNKVLRRLRHAQVDSLDSDYSALIADFVNLAKAEVEDAGPWRSLRNEKTITTVAGTAEYTLATTNERSYILTDHETGSPMLYRTDASGRHVIARTGIDQQQLQQDVMAPANSEPLTFTSWTANDGLHVKLFPKPDGIYNYKAIVITPQDDLADIEDELVVPTLPVVELAVWFAVNERGEELGEKASAVYERYLRMLGAATLTDFGAERRTWVDDRIY